MSVSKFAAQEFLPLALDKVRDLRRMLDERFAGRIEIDGGINEITGAEAVRPGWIFWWRIFRFNSRPGRGNKAAQSWY